MSFGQYGCFQGKLYITCLYGVEVDAIVFDASCSGSSLYGKCFGGYFAIGLPVVGDSYAHFFASHNPVAQRYESMSSDTFDFVSAFAQVDHCCYVATDEAEPVARSEVVTSPLSVYQHGCSSIRVLRRWLYTSQLDRAESGFVEEEVAFQYPAIAAVRADGYGLQLGCLVDGDAGIVVLLRLLTGLAAVEGIINRCIIDGT